MAHAAVFVQDQRPDLGFHGCASFTLTARLVLMTVMPKVRDGRGALVAAIDRCSRPAELEWQHDQHHEDDVATHVDQCSHRRQTVERGPNDQGDEYGAENAARWPGVAPARRSQDYKFVIFRSESCSRTIHTVATSVQRLR